MADAPNIWEAEGRRAKTEQLCRQIDKELVGTNGPTGTALLPDFLRAQDTKWWLALAQRAGVKTAIEKKKVPGPETREAVALYYEAQAAEDADREPEPDLDDYFGDDYSVDDDPAESER